jgi:hypothetical protein
MPLYQLSITTHIGDYSLHKEFRDLLMTYSSVGHTELGRGGMYR